MHNDKASYEFFMSEALQHAEKALWRGEFPVGSVLVYKDQIIAAGSREGTATSGTNEIDHAEMVALRALLDSGQQGDLAQVTLYSTMEPCLMCFATLLVNGVRKIVYGYEDAMGGGTNLPLHLLSPLYRDMGVEITGGVLRQKGLDLFKEFFANPDNDYLQDSLLSTYTLNQ